MKNKASVIHFDSIELRWLAIVVVCAMLFSAHSACFATTYRCTEAKDEATLTVTGSESVSTNHGDKKCRYTVSSASSSSSPPLNVPGRPMFVVNAMNNFLHGRTDKLSGSDLADFMVLLLGPFESESNTANSRAKFENAVRIYASDVGGCIASNGEQSRVERNNLICRDLIPADKPLGVNVFGIEVIPTEPLLVVGVEIDNKRYMIFTPKWLMELGRRDQIRFR